MGRLVFILILVAAIVAAFVLILRRPRTLLGKIHIAFTGLVILAFVVDMKIAFWLHSMAYADPVRQEWQSRLDVIGSIIWFGAIGSWLLFTLFHVVVVLRRRPRESV